MSKNVTNYYLQNGEMKMGNLTLEQILRYALPGGVVLIVLIGVYPESIGNCPIALLSVGGFAVAMGVSLLIGCLVYSLHRATFLLILNRVFQLINRFRLDPNLKKDWFVVRPSDEEIKLATLAWRLREGGELCSRSLSEWAAQIHYLLCSAWAILVGHWIAWMLGFTKMPHAYHLSWWVFGILVLAGLYHSFRYQYFETQVFRHYAKRFGCS